jgi:hypothetical protein
MLSTQSERLLANTSFQGTLCVASRKGGAIQYKVRSLWL